MDVDHQNETAPYARSALLHLQLAIENHGGSLATDLSDLLCAVVELVEAAHDYRMCSLAVGHDSEQREQRLRTAIALFR